MAPFRQDRTGLPHTMPKDTQATSLFFPLPVARHGRLVRDPLEARLPKGHGRLWTGPSVGADSAVRATRSFDHDTPHCQLRSPAKLWRVSNVSPSTNASSEQRKGPTRGLGVRMKVAVEVGPNRAERSPLRAVHPFRVPGLARSPLTLRWTLLSSSPDSAPGYGWQRDHVAKWFEEPSTPLSAEG